MLDLFEVCGHVRMHWDAIGSVWKISENFVLLYFIVLEYFRTFPLNVDVFGRVCTRSDGLDGVPIYSDTSQLRIS